MIRVNFCEGILHVKFTVDWGYILSVKRAPETICAKVYIVYLVLEICQSNRNNFVENSPSALISLTEKCIN